MFVGKGVTESYMLLLAAMILCPCVYASLKDDRSCSEFHISLPPSTFSTCLHIESTCQGCPNTRNAAEGLTRKIMGPPGLAS